MSAKLLGKTEEIVSAYVLKGQSLREVADQHGVSSGSIRSVLKKAGVTLRKRGRKPSGPVLERGFGALPPDPSVIGKTAAELAGE